MLVVIALGIAAKSDSVIEEWICLEWEVAEIAQEMEMPASKDPHSSSPVVPLQPLLDTHLDGDQAKKHQALVASRVQLQGPGNSEI